MRPRVGTVLDWIRPVETLISRYSGGSSVFDYVVKREPILRNRQRARRRPLRSLGRCTSTMQNRGDLLAPSSSPLYRSLSLSLSLLLSLLWYNFNDDSRLGLRPANRFNDVRSPALYSVRINESKLRARQRDIYLTSTRGKAPPLTHFRFLGSHCNMS